MTRLLLCLSLALCTLPAAIAAPVELPERAPIPQWREDPQAQDPRPQPAPANGQSSANALPRAEKACRENLRALGVIFTPATPRQSEDGCSLPYPINVTALSQRIKLRPPALLTCRTARAAARLFQGEGAAASRAHFDTRIDTVIQNSAYVCRPINGSKSLSQHAFGDALDIKGVLLADGRRIDVGSHQDTTSDEARFLAAIRKAACGTFTTVLGPGTDADHSDHFHFDMKDRRGPYCR